MENQFTQVASIALGGLMLAVMGIQLIVADVQTHWGKHSSYLIKVSHGATAIIIVIVALFMLIVANRVVDGTAEHVSVIFCLMVSGTTFGVMLAAVVYDYAKSMETRSAAHFLFGIVLAAIWFVVLRTLTLFGV